MERLCDQRPTLPWPPNDHESRTLSALCINHTDRVKTELQRIPARRYRAVESLHDTPRRARPLSDSPPAGIAGRLCRPGQPGPVHRRFCRRAGSRGRRVRSRSVEGNWPSGLCARRPAEAVRLRLPESDPLQLTGSAKVPFRPGEELEEAGFVTTAYRNGVPDEEIMGHPPPPKDRTTPS